MVTWIKLVLKRTFGTNVVSVRRDGSIRHDDNFTTLFLAGGVAVGVACTSLIVLGAAAAPIVGVLYALGCGAASGVTAGLIWRRNALPIKTGTGRDLAYAYAIVRRLLPRGTRAKARQAVLAHDSNLLALHKSLDGIRQAQCDAGQQPWSSPLLLGELETREQELRSEIDTQKATAERLTEQFRTIVRVDRDARAASRAATKAVTAATALTQSRRALNAARTTRIPQLELL